MVGFAAADLHNTVITFARENAGYLPAVVFMLGFAESIVLVSLLVPSSILFIALGGLYSAAGGALWTIWLAGAAGAVVGDSLSYAIGFHFKSRIPKIWPFTRMPDLVPQGHAFMERWGVWSIVAGKFVGGLRPFIPVAAGMLEMPWLSFIVASMVSSLAWAGVFLAPGYGIAMLPW